jgi:xanthine dehydrogenase small subunit
MAMSLTVNGKLVEVSGEGASLLDVLREQLGLRSVKDGCSPQGQCGCCTVLVDGAPRVACVTPARRVAGREVTTLEGLDETDRRAWAEAFSDVGASQCGFCTPGIILRLQGLRAKRPDPARPAVDQALAAHLCRCTGWQTIGEACQRRAGAATAPVARRDFDAAARRATIEGRSPQRVGPMVALGEGQFADDTAPPDALVAVPDGAGGWAVGETMVEARAAAGKVQGRRTTIEATPPLALPEGDWAVTLQTAWVEPGYLETDASWCAPGGEPVSPLANGGAFGAKLRSPVAEAARRLAGDHGRVVRVVLSREDVVQLGPKRPPMAVGLRRDGSGTVRVVRTPGIAELITAASPSVTVEEVDVPGPPTSVDLRAAGWAELAVAQAALAGRPSDPITITSPDGATARVAIAPDGSISVDVACGDPLDEIVLRSYAIGAVHQALGWVTSEGLATDEQGRVLDLTIRSFGIIRSSAMPHVDVHIDRSTAGPPVNGSDAVFAAAAAAAWIHQGLPPAWPTRLPWPPAPSAD